MDKLVTENDKCNKTQLERRESKGREKRSFPLIKLCKPQTKVR